MSNLDMHVNAALDRIGATVELRQLLEAPGEGAQLRERRAVAMRNLRHLGGLRAVIEQEIIENVAIARTAASSWYDYGAPTWEEIGQALGVTKQAAASRYRNAAPRTE